ncbi:PucR family transcriptional regulator [Niallia sp. 03133]|uniref:PucR family transcriptional regulator n=1 Tax=Niallia sp. 03133 TaxID=3458060 RepID=UPI0040446D24
MKHKLLSYFQHTMEQTSPPSPAQLELYYWFTLSAQNEWFGIHKKEVDDSQLDLLKNLFDYFLPEENNQQEELVWSQFLYLQGEMPPQEDQGTIRMIQFHIKGKDLEKGLMSDAFADFICSDSLLIWKNHHEGVIVERNQHYIQEEAFVSFAQAIQTDFFATITFFIGKEVQLSPALPTIFIQEKNIFSKGLSIIPSQSVLSLEKILPALFIHRLASDELELFNHCFSIFKEDKEVLLTIQTFIENNGHSTNTAKQLYIHRNTLQYRLDKFTEKTGFHLKDFSSFFTTYLACLLFNPSNQP